MKFKKIKGENFKCYEEFDFEPKKTTCAIVGKNGKGKTSLVQMIKYALTGELPDNAVKNGTDELRVTCEVQDGKNELVWTRCKSETRGSRVMVNGRTSTIKALSSYIEELTTLPFESLRISASSDIIEKMKPEELSDFVMNYIPEQLDYNIIKSYIGDSISQEAYELLENGEFIPTTGTFLFDQLQKTYDALFAARKDARSKLVMYDNKMSGGQIFKPSSSMEEVKKRLEDILKEEGKYAEALKSVEAYNKAVQMRDKQIARIKELEDKVKSCKVDKPNAEKAKELNSRMETLQSSIISLNTTINTMKNNIETFKKTVENLDKPICPLSEGLICNTDKSVKKQEFLDQIKSNEESIKTIEAEIKNKNDEMLDVKNAITAHNECVNKYREYTFLLQELENSKKTLITLPEKPVAPTEIKDYTQEKERLYELQRQNIEYEKFLENKNEYDRLLKLKTNLDKLVPVFAPKGDVNLKITQFYFNIFEDSCNEIAKELKPDFTIRFVPENGIKIYCETKAGMGYVPYESCSSGERAFVIFLLTDLISRALTRSNILILDDLDKLDENAFASLMECVMNPAIQDAYDHIILSAVDHPDTLTTLSKYSNDIEILNV